MSFSGVLIVVVGVVSACVVRRARRVLAEGHLPAVTQARASLDT